MTLRNDLTASKQKLIMVAIATVSAVSSGAAFFPEYLEPQWLSLALAGAAYLILLLRLAANHHYLWLVVEGDKLKLRYYSVFQVMRKYQAIEIPLSGFRGYAVQKKWGGLRRELVLYQQVKNQRAAYPPVPIVTLTHREYNALLAILNKYARS